MTAETLKLDEPSDTSSSNDLNFEELNEQFLDIATRFHDGGDFHDAFREQIGVITTPLKKFYSGAVPTGGNQVYFKNETVQPTGAYKVRGGSTGLLLARERNPNLEKVLCGSQGNHGLGVTYPALRLGLSSEVHLPRTATDFKQVKLWEAGAKVISHYKTLPEAIKMAEHLADSIDNYAFLHPYNSIDTIAGQSTVMYESLLQLVADPDIDELNDDIEIVVPGGGLGLAAGSILELFRAQTHGIVGDNVSVTVVEVQDIDTDGRLTSKENIDWCDGTATTSGHLGALVVNRYLGDRPRLTVSSTEVAQAQHELTSGLMKRVEPAGALATAGVKKLIAERLGQKPKIYVSFVTGANVSEESYRYGTVLRQAKYRNVLNSIGALTLTDTKSMPKTPTGQLVLQGPNVRK